jgi:hypothetical protein
MLIACRRFSTMGARRTGENRADLATKLGFSRARITQIMELLCSRRTSRKRSSSPVSPTGRDVVTKRDVRKVVKLMASAEQRRIWREVREKFGPTASRNADARFPDRGRRCPASTLGPIADQLVPFSRIGILRTAICGSHLVESDTQPDAASFVVPRTACKWGSIPNF